MDLHLALRGRGRLAADAYRQLRLAILEGRLRPGQRLPATRELARRLQISRNTAIRAYGRLLAEGFAEARTGAGTYVAAGIAQGLPRRAPAGDGLRARPPWDLLADEARAPAAPYDFRVGAPDPALFPWDEWRPLIARQLRGHRPRAGYPPPEGEPAARAAIARHVGVSRAVRASADDVLITAGAQQALDLIGRVLLSPGDCVAVEEPGYPQAIRLFRSLGARVLPVPVDGEGIDVAALPRDARLVYVTPSHQFPLGVRLSLQRRLALLEFCERRRAAVIEDDYDTELRFEGRPLDPLQALDRRGRVLYVGTFSKVLLPTLRLGFVVAPASLLPALREARALSDSHGPPEQQRALAELIDQGLFARHLRRLHRVYGERRARLLEALRRELADLGAAVPSSAGLHLSFLFADGRVDEARAVRAALAAGVAVDPLRPYFQLAPRPGFALGYGLIPAQRIDEGVRRLAAAIRDISRRRQR